MKSKNRFLILEYLNFVICFYDFKQTLISQRYQILLGQHKSNISHPRKQNWFRGMNQTLSAVFIKVECLAIIFPNLFKRS